MPTKSKPRSVPISQFTDHSPVPDQIDYESLSEKEKKVVDAIRKIGMTALVAEQCRRSFKYFVKKFWSVAEPGSPLIDGWHLDAMCDHLQAAAEGRIRNLIIAVPPRHSKSSIVSVFFAAWVWIRWPGKRFFYCSFAQALSNRDSRKCRNLIESTEYQKHFADTISLANDSNTILRFDNNQGGMRFATSVGGLLTGEGANFVIADDLHNLSEIHSDLKRMGANTTWDETISSRLNPPIEEGHFIIIAQRGHSDDLIGHIKEQDKKLKQYTILELPAEYDPDMHCKTYLGKDKDGKDVWFEDPRKNAGELLWPIGCPKDYLDTQRIKLGTYSYNAQYQQRPVPKEGGIFTMSWFQRYDPVFMPSSAFWDDSCISIDMNFGSVGRSAAQTTELSYVVGTVWCRIGANFYLMDMIRGQWNYVEARREILKLILAWPQIDAKYVENKANGPAIMADLMETYGMTGIIPIDPKDWGGDKKSRAYSITPICEAHNVWLPHEDSQVGQRIMFDVLTELSTFPLGATNDIVDSITQALNKMRHQHVVMGVGVGDGELPIEIQQSLTQAHFPMNMVPGVDVPMDPIMLAAEQFRINNRPGQKVIKRGENHFGHPAVQKLDFVQTNMTMNQNQLQFRAEQPQEQFMFASAEVPGEEFSAGINRQFGGSRGGFNVFGGFDGFSGGVGSSMRGAGSDSFQSTYRAMHDSRVAAKQAVQGAVNSVSSFWGNALG